MGRRLAAGLAGLAVGLTAGVGALVPASWAAPAAQLEAPVDLTKTVGRPGLLPPVDLDGDGDLDLVAFERAGGALFGFENEGASFGPRRRLARIPSGESQWLVADVDLDGDLDAVAVAVDPIRIHLFQDLDWQEATDTSRIDGQSGSLVGLALADLDGNGRADLVFAADGASAGSKGLFACFGRLSGGFSRATRVAPWSANVDGITTGAIRIAALNNDARPDILVEDAERGRVVWFRNAGGGLTSGPIPVAEGFETIAAVDAGDLDADGRPEIVVVAAAEPAATPGAGPMEVRVYALASGATYTPLGVVASLPDADPPTGSSLADVDGDGDLDLFVPRSTNERSAWLENDGTGLAGPLRELPAAPAFRLTEASIADVDGDGSADIAAIGADEAIGWFRGLGGGTFDSPREVTERVLGARSAVALDADRDGDLDLAIVEGGGARLIVLENLRSDGYGPPAPSPAGLAGIDRLAVGDLDGDSDDDLVLASFREGWLARSLQGPTGLGAPSTFYTFAPTDGGHVVLADVDDDGALELVVSLRGHPDLLAFETFGGAPSPAPRTLLSGLSDAAEFVVADLDADGKSDVVVTGSGFGGTVGWFRGVGAGSFAPRSAISTLNFVPTRVLAFDAEGDGDLDLAIGGGGTIFPLLEWIPQTAPGVFGPSEYVGTGIVGWSFLAACDVDLDGDVDLVATPLVGPADSTELAVYTAPFGDLPRSFERPRGVSSLLVGDFDADGDADVVTTSETGNAVSLFAGMPRSRIGEPGCEGTPNSTGERGRLEALGSQRLVVDDLRLRAYGLPRRAYCAFLASRVGAHVVAPGGSVGALCLGGAIGVFTGPGAASTSSAFGEHELTVDLQALPQASGGVAAIAGETWHFQAWYRDAGGPAASATTNFTDSIRLTFR